MATARLDIRLDEQIKAKAEKASALLGLKSLTDYVVRLLDENATQVIAQHERVVVCDDVFDQFVLACEQAKGRRCNRQCRHRIGRCLILFRAAGVQIGPEVLHLRDHRRP